MNRNSQKIVLFMQENTDSAIHDTSVVSSRRFNPYKLYLLFSFFIQYLYYFDFPFLIVFFFFYNFIYFILILFILN